MLVEDSSQTTLRTIMVRADTKSHCFIRKTGTFRCYGSNSSKG